MNQFFYRTKHVRALFFVMWRIYLNNWIYVRFSKERKSESMRVWLKEEVKVIWNEHRRKWKHSHIARVSNIFIKIRNKWHKMENSLPHRRWHCYIRTHTHTPLFTLHNFFRSFYKFPSNVLSLWWKDSWLKCWNRDTNESEENKFVYVWVFLLHNQQYEWAEQFLIDNHQLNVYVENVPYKVVYYSSHFQMAFPHTHYQNKENCNMFLNFSLLWIHFPFLLFWETEKKMDFKN